MDAHIPYSASVMSFLDPAGDPSPLRAGVDYTPAHLCCEASRLVHAQFETSPAAKAKVEEAMGRAGFDAFRFFWEGDTEGFAARRAEDGVLLVAFRGTELGTLDVMTDLKTWTEPWLPREGGPQAGRVHAGFAQASRLIWPKVERAMAELDHSRLWITGHSLGAALATLTASRRTPELLCTFGSPRVGDFAFGESMREVNVVRYVQCADLVCSVPFRWMGFSHLGKEHYIDRKGQIVGAIVDADCAADRSAARWDYARRHFIRRGWVPTRDIADHAPINYVSAFFGREP